MEKRIASELNVRPAQVKAVLQLTEEGGTIPFIARYRKEQTGELDEVAIKAILDRHKQLTQLESRRSDVLEKIEEQGALTPELVERSKKRRRYNKSKISIYRFDQNVGQRRKLHGKQGLHHLPTGSATSLLMMKRHSIA